METILFCPWEPSSYLFFSENVPPLVHYSHFVAIFAVLSMALLVFSGDPRSVVSRLFLAFSSFFSVWVLLDVVLWATNDPAVVMFSWSMQILTEPIMYATAFYLFYVYLYGKIPRLRVNMSLFVLMLPLVLLLPTNLTMEYIFLSTCEIAEGPVAKYLAYALNLLFIFLIAFVGWRGIRSTVLPTRRRAAVFFYVGLLTFLSLFNLSNIVGSITGDWTVVQYGLLGVPVFLALVAYSIIKFQDFKLEVAGAQIMVAIVWLLVASLLFVKAEFLELIIWATLIFTTVTGYLLVKSVKKEFKQRRRIESLMKSLEAANLRLKQVDQRKSEFVSIASHQLRSPLTSILGYASMLRDGSFGQLSVRATEAADRIEQSAKMMADSIEDYLNVSRIEAGTMKFNHTDFNLKDEVGSIVDDLRVEAQKKGVALSFRAAVAGKGVVHSDLGKVQQIIHNLINNAVKYTERGDITVLVRDDLAAKTITMEVTDTGIGMSRETLSTIFHKFGRGKNADNISVHGTGLGLYTAQKLAGALGGRIEAHSEGEGKGSRFALILPLDS
jgi:signal transduction histidine kinase